MTFPWTRLAGTPLFFAAKATYDADPRRRYHTWYHVGRLYAQAAEWDLPYDPDLDKAILAHDVIYDAHKDKEVRSAQWLQLMTGQACKVETMMIESTIAHEILPGHDNRIQLLDLADLGRPELVAPNRELIFQEINLLNGVTRDQFARGNLAHFEPMRARYSDDLIASLEPSEAERLLAIRNGIDTTIQTCLREIG